MMGGSNGGKGKTICTKCKRTIVIVMLETPVEGELVRTALDPEVISTVAFPTGTVRQTSRRVHAELCGTYQAEAERRRLRGFKR